MGCGCNKNKNNSPEKIMKTKRDAPRKAEVEASILRTRKNICRLCPYSTKRSKKPKFQFVKMDTLGPISKCTKDGGRLQHILPKPNFECPMGKFQKSTPKVRK